MFPEQHARSFFAFHKCNRRGHEYTKIDPARKPPKTTRIAQRRCQDATAAPLHHESPSKRTLRRYRAKTHTTGQTKTAEQTHTRARTHTPTAGQTHIRGQTRTAQNTHAEAPRSHPASSYGLLDPLMKNMFWRPSKQQFQKF